MQITVTGMKGNQLRAWTANLRRAKDPINQCLAYMRQAITTKAQLGSDINGAPYVPYSKNYMLWCQRQQNINPKHSFGGSWMNLYGTMLSAMRQKSDNRRGVLGYWGGNPMLARALQNQNGNWAGRGVVRPVKKRALWWPGLPHAVASAKACIIKIPSRKWFGFRDGDKSACNAIFQKWVVEQCQNTGLVITPKGSMGRIPGWLFAVGGSKTWSARVGGGRLMGLKGEAMSGNVPNWMGRMKI